jgi:RNA polymerase sigma-70 factor (ECF subfamily)
MQHLPLDDKTILLSCSHGDTMAFKKLFEAYRMKVYATSFKITKSAYATEEIVQEVFISLWEGRLNLKNVDKPSGYIFKIAYNKINRYLKKAENDRKLLRGFEQRLKDDEHNSTEEWLNLKEVEGLINQAVGSLPPQRKRIYKLSREEGLNNEEIAKHLDSSISPLTVKKHLMLALSDLRSTLVKSYV